MKKLSFFFALFAMLFLNVGFAQGETATIAYDGNETTNMTGGNDAALVGLDASMWSVVADQGGAQNLIGLNKDGDMRLYAQKDSGNGNILTVSISEGTIDEITLDIKQKANYEVKAAGDVVTATNETTYTIGASSFSIQNTHKGESTQLKLNSITIKYTSTGDNTPDDGGDDVTPDDGGDDVTPDDGGDDVTPGAGATFTFNSVEKQTKNGYTVTLEKGNGTNVPAYKDEWGMVRLYNKNTITIEGGQITSMKITYTKTKADKAYAEVTANVGTYISGGESTEVNQEVTDTWNGSAEKVVLTLGDTGQRGLIKLVINEGSSNTPDDGGDDTPDDGGTTTPDTPVTGTAITGLQYADAFYYEYDGVGYYDLDMYKDADMDTYEYIYPEVYISFEAKSKTALNGTYDVLYAGYWSSANDSVEINEQTVGTVTIKNTDNEGNYSIQGSFVGTDGKTYTFNDVVSVWALDYDTFEEIVLNETGGTDTPDTPGTDNPVAGTVTFDADVDKGNAGTDSNNATAYQVSKEGVTMEVSSGILGTYNNEMHYRIYKGQTLTLTSTAGNIVSVEFTCTANDDEKYGPGCWTVDSGDYDYAGAVGTWTGSAASVTFTATANQVRTSQIVVKLGGTAVEDVLVGETPIKMIKNGQLMIIRGENTYNVLGAQVK